jgi:molybdate transport system regulatory protein
MPGTGWAKDWTVGVRVWIERQGEALLGQGKAELLDAIDKQGSLTAAAKTAGMSYRKAWTLIQQVNEAAGEALVSAAVGGAAGGGMQLTPRGKFALQTYQDLYAAMHLSSAEVLRRVTSQKKSPPCVHLAAAISLQEAIGQILAHYALRRPTIQVRAVYGASNELADHLLAGAPGDIFIAADRTDIDRLIAAKKIVTRSVATITMNGLAFIGRSKQRFVSASDLLTAKNTRVVLADPVCPLGRYSKKYLQAVGIYEELLPKVMHVDNSRAVLSAVASGAAQIGLSFSSDAQRANCPTLLHVPLNEISAEYRGGLIRGEKPSAEVREIYDFLTSETAQQCFRQCGFRAMKHA